MKPRGRHAPWGRSLRPQGCSGNKPADPWVFPSPPPASVDMDVSEARGERNIPTLSPVKAKHAGGAM